MKTRFSKNWDAVIDQYTYFLRNSEYRIVEYSGIESRIFQCIVGSGVSLLTHETPRLTHIAEIIRYMFFELDFLFF